MRTKMGSPTAQAGQSLSDNATISKGAAKYCICGLPCPANQKSCDSCQGKFSVHIEGEILKKQKKGGELKKYWFVLLGKELYSYKKPGDLKHKEMKSLAGVYLKDELSEEE